jgi:hypothetical protein
MRGNEIEVFAPCNTEQKPNTKVGDRVFAIYRGEWEMVGGVGGGSTLFPVVLKYIGGNQGTASTPATWKYYVYMLDGVTRLENEPIDPTEFPHQWKRPSIGAMSIATFGYAHYNDERKIVIGWINEVALQERCFI